MKGVQKMSIPINPPEWRRWQIGEGSGIENFNYYNVSIDAYPMPTTTIIQTIVPTENYFQH